jgi:hypothetical protein
MISFLQVQKEGASNFKDEAYSEENLAQGKLVIELLWHKWRSRDCG